MRGVDTPVLVITSRDSARDRTAAFAVGADGYLFKPFDLAKP